MAISTSMVAEKTFLQTRATALPDAEEASNQQQRADCAPPMRTLPNNNDHEDEPVRVDISRKQAEGDAHHLAAHMTTRPRSGQQHFNLFRTQDKSPLDPTGPCFSAQEWTQTYHRLRTVAADGSSPRTISVAYKNLNVCGFGTPTDYQKTIANVALGMLALFRNVIGRGRKQRLDILRDLEGVVHSGEMLCVLGPPGSGCSTMLKTIAGDTYGFRVSDGAIRNYQGIRPEQMRANYRGEAVYIAEVDEHFSHLSVGDTLYFAARSRTPRRVPGGMTKKEYAEHLRDVIMAIFGIAHTKDTRVGNEFVKGVSGGERKRVTIAEVALGFAPLQCWDNSTRGLDSANAIEFCRALRMQSDVMGITSCVAIYQAPQTAYDVSVTENTFRAYRLLTLCKAFRQSCSSL